MTTATPIYGSVVTHTITLSALASDANLLAGRQGTAIDQKDTDDAVDALVGGKITLGTGPTTARQIEFWAYGTFDDATFNDAITGSDGNLTLIAKTTLRLLTIIPTNATTEQVYRWGPYSIAQAFGGIVPVQWGIWCVHNTAVNLKTEAGTDHFVKHIPVKFESA